MQERATNAAVTNADEVMTPTVFRASVPVTLELPLSMVEAVAEVLGGSYDAPYSGAGATILDIGAHVGAFTLWANMRWPGSRLFAYEPHPQTFASLQRNTLQLPDVRCVRAAVYPSRQETLPFYSRFAGDGEAGVVDVLQRIFNSLPEQGMFEVPVIHPANLPPADIVKIDTEGAEAAILEAMDLEPVSLIILQYHFDEERERIKELLQPRFTLEYESALPWQPLLAESEYRSSLAGDHYGQLCFVNRAHERLRPVAAEVWIPATETAHAPADVAEASNGQAPGPYSPAASPDRRQPAARPIANNSPSLVYLYDLLAIMVMRDMKLRYKRSVMGIAWSLLNPLAQLAVFGFVFRFVLPLDIPNYTAFLFIGILAWSWFQGSLQQATGAIVENGALIGYPGFPVAVLPVVTVTSHLVHYLLALPIVVVFLLASGISFNAVAALLPVVVLIQFVLSLSLAFLVATLQVFFRDTQYLLGIALMLGFFLTPIFYDLSTVPARFHPFYRLNPMYILVEAYRDILVRGILPDVGSLLLLGLLSILLLGAGYRLFSRTSFRFVEQI